MDFWYHFLIFFRQVNLIWCRLVCLVSATRVLHPVRQQAMMKLCVCTLFVALLNLVSLWVLYQASVGPVPGGLHLLSGACT